MSTGEGKEPSEGAHSQNTWSTGACIPQGY